MISLLLVSITLVLPQIPGVYQGPGCVGHPARPPVSYTNRLKREQIQSLGYIDTDPRDYQEDHLVSLAIGGNPTDPNNLWPQPQAQAHRDDRIEYDLYRRACLGRGRPLAIPEAVRWERVWKHKHG